MIEKIDINEVERNLSITNSVDYLRGLKGTNGVLITPKMLLRSHLVETETTLIDCNEIKYNSTIAGYIWKNSPRNVISLMETILYSRDWIIQRFTSVEDIPKMWIRSYYGGSTWGEWMKVNITT